MAVTAIAIAVPEGLGRRAAIEWTVNHLIKVLDRMDADEDSEREGFPDVPTHADPSPPLTSTRRGHQYSLTLVDPPLMGDPDAL